MKRNILFLLLTLLLFTLPNFPSKPNPTTEEKINQLLTDMTLKEKIGQMIQISIGAITKPHPPLPNKKTTFILDEKKLKKLMKKYQVGSFLGGKAISTIEWVNFIDHLQRQSMQYQKHHIPMIYGIDHVHGADYLAEGTVFPHNINLAATFDPEYACHEGRITAEETAALGHHWNFAPILGIAQNKKWPRFYETFGEDPYLTSRMGTAFIKGTQENKNSLPYKIAACAKHFLGYSNPITGFDRSPAVFSDQELHELYRPPFQAAVDAGVQTVMVNSGEINGIPVHANPEILIGLLRSQMGFTGVAISDWEDIVRLKTAHRVAESEKEATLLAISSGIDVSMTTKPDFCIHLKELVEEGRIPVERIDQSVRRVLRLKYSLGLFDHPYPDLAKAQKAFEPWLTYREINRSAARESIVLIKNQNNTLPLSPGTKRIVLAGPNANLKNPLCGGWSYEWHPKDDTWFPEHMLTLYDALKKEFSNSTVELAPDDQLEHRAQDADAVMLAVGEAPYAEGFGSIIDLDLPGEQVRLIQRAIDTKKPVVLILIEGRPRTIAGVFDKCDAVLFAGLPGIEGGQAIAEIIAGKVNPSGKMPFTYPYKQGHILSYFHKHHAFSPMHKIHGERLRYSIAEFGHGLSYTTFEYSDLTLDKDEVGKHETLTARVTVTNTGTVAGKEAVLWFISDEVASITRPVKLLKYFEKQEIKPGESLSFLFEIVPGEHLSFPDGNGNMLLEIGEFTLSVENLKKKFYLK